MELVSQRKRWLGGVALGLLLLVGSLLAYYMGDQTGRVAVTAVSFTIDTRDPDSVVLAIAGAE